MRQVNNYISKLFENVGELTYTEPDDSEKNLFEITGVRSVLGEHLPLKQVREIHLYIDQGVTNAWEMLVSSCFNNIQCARERAICRYVVSSSNKQGLVISLLHTFVDRVC